MFRFVRVIRTILTFLLNVYTNMSWLSRQYVEGKVESERLQFDCVSMFVSAKTPILNETSRYIRPIQPFVLNETSGRFPAISGARKNIFLMGSLDVSSCFRGDQFSNLGQNLIWTLTRPEHSVVKNLQLDQEEVLTYRWFIEMYINNMNSGD